MFKKISYLSLYLVLFSIYSVNSAEVKQGVVSRGMKVKEATENTVVSSVCKQKFYGCMDSFCMLENTNGGRCMCSDRKSELDSILAEIDKIDAKSKQMATEGVENVKMGENAEEIRSRADAAVANVSKRADLKIAKEESKEKKSGLDLSIFDTDVDFDSEVDSIFDKKEKQDAEISLANKTGKALYDAVSNICKSKMQECDKDAGMLSMMYSQQIKSDCGAYENYLQQRKKKSSELLAVAEREVRTAALDKFQEENKYDPGQCVSEYSKCMIAECGEDYSKCVNVVDLEKAGSTEGIKELDELKLRGFEEFNIKRSTFAVLESKREKCNTVLKYCKKAAPGVWMSYLKVALPAVKSAELMIQSNRRQNCLSDVSNCFLKACKDRIDPNNKEGSYDLCLSNPKTVENQCFRELDRCGNKDDIFKLVKLRLGAMRVDACTKQVKKILTDEDRCGKDYVNCIGMDLESFKAMVPVEALTACGEDGEKIPSMDKLDNMLQGIYVSIDNKLASACQAGVEEIFNKECPEGNCEKLFESMKIDLEKNSPLKLDKESDGSYVLSGLIDYGNLEIKKITNNNTSIYNIDKDGYITNIDNSDDDKYKERVKLYLEKLEKSVSNVMNKFSTDPIISNCMSGRDLKQIKGTSTVKEYEKNADGSVKLDNKGDPQSKGIRARGDKTEGRFPNLLDSLSSRIAKQALDVSTAVYAKAYQEKMSELVKLSPDPDKIAKALCYSMFKDSNKENWHCVKTAGLKRAKSEGKKHDNYYYPCVEYNYIGVLKTDNFDLKETDSRSNKSDKIKYRTFIKYTNTKLDNFLKDNLIEDKLPKEILYQTKANDDKTTVLHETKITLGNYYNGVCEILQHNNCIYKQYDCSVNTDILSGTIKKIYYTR